MENISKVTYGVVSLVVIVLLIATIAIPVIENSQSMIRTSDNNTTMRFSAVDTADNVNLEIVYDSDEDNPVFVGDYNIPLASSGVTYLVALSESFVIYKFTTHSNLVVIHDGIQNPIVSASISDGILSFADKNTSTEYTVEVSGNLLYAAEKGSYGEFFGSSINLNKGDVVYAVHNSSSALNKVGGEGTLTIGSLLKTTVGDSTTLAYTPLVYNYGTLDSTKLTSYGGTQTLTYDSDKDLYNLSNTTISLSATYDSENYARNISTSIFAPIEYTYVSVNDSAIVQLLSIIPLIMCIVPIMVVVGFISSRRD